MGFPLALNFALLWVQLKRVSATALPPPSLVREEIVHVMLADSVATLYLSVMRTESGSPSDSKLQICVADSPVGRSREREREDGNVCFCCYEE